MTPKFMSPRQRFLLFFLPLTVFLLIVIGTIREFQYQHKTTSDTFHERVDDDLDVFAAIIQDDLNKRLLVLTHLKKRWELNSKGMSKEAWMEDTKNIIEDFPGFQAIEWVDKQNVVRWIMPLTGNEAAQDIQLTFESSRKKALEEAKASRSIVITPVIDLVQGGKGFLCYLPIYKQPDPSDQAVVNEATYDGFILGVFNFEKWIRHIKPIQLHNHMHIQFSVGDQMIYQSHKPGEQDELLLQMKHTKDILLKQGLSWKISASPIMPGHLTDGKNFQLLYAGMIIAATCMLTIFLGLHSTYQNRTLQLTSRAFERDKLYPLLAQKMSAMIWRCDPVGRFVEKQKAWEEITGQSWEQYRNFGWKDVLHEDDRDALVERWESTVETKSHFYTHARAWSDLHQDYRQYAIHVDPLLDEQGQVIEWVGMYVDIQDFYDAERKLQQSEQKAQSTSRLLQKVIDSIPSRVFWKDKERRYLGCNLSFARDAGFDNVEAMIGKHDSELPWADRVERYKEDDIAVMTSGVARENYEEPLTLEDGKILWLRTSKVPLKDKRDQVFGFLGIYEDITERKQNELELKLNKERFQLAMRGGQIGDWIYDVVKRKIQFGELWYRQLKRKVVHEPIDIKQMYDYMHPDDQDSFENALQHYLLNSQNDIVEFRHEQRFKCSDGTWCWMISVAEVAEHDENGDPILLTGFHLNVTPIREMQTELLRVNQQFDLAIRGGNIGTWEWDLDTRACVYNNVLFKILGRKASKEPVQFETIKSWIHPDDFELSIENAMRHITGETGVYRQEQRYLRADGSWCWLLAVGEVTERDRNGEPLKMAGVHVNIDELKTTQIELNTLNDRFELAIESAGYGLFDWNCQTGEIHHFDSWYTMNGYEHDELPKSYDTWKSLVHPDDLPEVRKLLDEHLAGKTEKYMATYRMLQKSGDWCWIRAIGVATEFDRQGIPLRMVGVQTNITDIKNTEIELNQAVDYLQQKQREMEQFVYAISHDLKSPIVSCMGFINFMEEDLASGNLEEVKFAMSRMDKNLRQMSDCINDILELSRIGRVRNNPEHVNLNHLIHDVLENMREEIERKAVVVNITDDLPGIFVDKLRMTQVFQNLIGNALKYGCYPIDELGDKRNQIDILIENSSEKFFRIGISDQGPGIDKKFHDRIFELFQRLHSREEGTGVGLTIVKRIMENLGGTIMIESGQQSGTEESMDQSERLLDHGDSYQEQFGARFWLSFPTRLFRSSESGVDIEQDEITTGRGQ